ncbi:MAG: isopeptide-forming domain-containing fimbrial protein, partial [Coprobacillaceae bacterium]
MGLSGNTFENYLDSFENVTKADLTSGKYNLVSATVTDAHKLKVETTTLTNNFSNIKSDINNLKAEGSTPTATGLKNALESYEENKGNTDGRNTIFLLITDGVANVDVDGVHYGGGTFNEANSIQLFKFSDLTADKKPINASKLFYIDVLSELENVSALPDVSVEANKVKSKGYTFNVGFFNNYKNGPISSEDREIYDKQEVLDYVNGSTSVMPAPKYASYNSDYLIPTAAKHMETWASSDGFYLPVLNDDGSIDSFLDEMVRQTLNQIDNSYINMNVHSSLSIVENSLKLTEQPVGNTTSPKFEGNELTWPMSVGAPAGDYEITFKVRGTTKGNYGITVSGIQNGVSINESKDVNITSIEGCRPLTPEKSVSDTDGSRETNNLELVNRNDTFNWYIQYAFPTYTDGWDEVVLTDSIHEFLKLNGNEIQIKDTTGLTDAEDFLSAPDISNTLWNNQTTNNDIKIELLKDTDYTWLSDKTITIIVPTKIKDTVTNAELRDWISANTTIPNTGKINVTTLNHGNFDIDSNLAEVKPIIPALEVPTIN